jgi:hypothetical protein
MIPKQATVVSALDFPAVPANGLVPVLGPDRLRSICAAIGAFRVHDIPRIGRIRGDSKLAAVVLEASYAKHALLMILQGDV